MKYKQIIWISILVLLTFAYAWYEAKKPREIDWSRTYSYKDKIPYGTYILYQSLPHLFPHAGIIPTTASLYGELQKAEKNKNTVYLSVSHDFKIDQAEVEHLLEWIRQGNQAFIAANAIEDTLLNLFNIKLDYSQEATKSRLSYGGLENKIYPEAETFASYFKLPVNFAGEILGGDERDSMPDFIRISCGKGQLWLNTKPAQFVNYALLDSIWGDYYYKALSALPENTGKVIWDAYRTRKPALTPLRVILKYPPLKLALYLALAGALLYAVFRARREQRPVPVILPPQNRMLEFVSTVSLLYYKKKEHYSVALKRIDFFLDIIRSRYMLHTDKLDDTFIDGLSERSGIERSKTAALVHLINQIKTEKQVTAGRLEQLMEETEKFIGSGEAGRSGKEKG